jgi:hypothetical protein
MDLFTNIIAIQRLTEDSFREEAEPASFLPEPAMRGSANRHTLLAGFRARRRAASAGCA